MHTSRQSFQQHRRVAMCNGASLQLQLTIAISWCAFESESGANFKWVNSELFPLSIQLTSLQYKLALAANLVTLPSLPLPVQCQQGPRLIKTVWILVIHPKRSSNQMLRFSRVPMWRTLMSIESFTKSLWTIQSSFGVISSRTSICIPHLDQTKAWNTTSTAMMGQLVWNGFKAQLQTYATMSWTGSFKTRAREIRSHSTGMAFSDLSYEPLVFVGLS